MVTVPTEGDFSSVDDVYTNFEIDTFAIVVSVAFVDPHQKPFYIGCRYCGAATNANYNCTYACTSCNRVTTAYPRGKIVIKVTDGPTAVKVVIFGRMARDFTWMSPSACMERYLAGEELPVTFMMRMLQHRLFVMYVKRHDLDNEHDGHPCRYVVLNKREFP